LLLIAGRSIISRVSVVTELCTLLAQPLPLVFVVTMAPDIAVLIITAYVGYSLYSLQIQQMIAALDQLHHSLPRARCCVTALR